MNRRAEIWGAMRDWLQVGALPEYEDLAIDLTSPEHGFPPQDQIQLERKESMAPRGLASPDSADAVAVTFAISIAVLETHGLQPFECREVDRLKVLNYNPFNQVDQFAWQ